MAHRQDPGGWGGVFDAPVCRPKRAESMSYPVTRLEVGSLADGLVKAVDLLIVQPFVNLPPSDTSRGQRAHAPRSPGILFPAGRLTPLDRACRPKGVTQKGLLRAFEVPVPFFISLLNVCSSIGSLPRHRQRPPIIARPELQQIRHGGFGPFVGGEVVGGLFAEAASEHRGVDDSGVQGKAAMALGGGLAYRARGSGPRRPTWCSNTGRFSREVDRGLVQELTFVDHARGPARIAAGRRGGSRSPCPSGSRRSSGRTPRREDVPEPGVGVNRAALLMRRSGGPILGEERIGPCLYVGIIG